MDRSISRKAMPLNGVSVHIVFYTFPSRIEPKMHFQFCDCATPVCLLWSVVLSDPVQLVLDGGLSVWILSPGT